VATFSSTDPLTLILEDLACPACGHQDSADAYKRVAENKVRVFCDNCGAFVTILLSDEQAAAIRLRLSVLTPISHLPEPFAPQGPPTATIVAGAGRLDAGRATD
jgi:hypothetical protein